MSSPTPTGTAYEPDPEDGATKRQVAPLLARRRDRLDRDAHIKSDRFSFRREGDGHKIRRVVVVDKTGEHVTDHDLTVLEGAAPSTTSNLEVLRLEARQAAEADETEMTTMNPHVPSNDDVLETAIEAIESEGLVPAWGVVDSWHEVRGK